MNSSLSIVGLTGPMSPTFLLNPRNSVSSGILFPYKRLRRGAQTAQTSGHEPIEHERYIRRPRSPSADPLHQLTLHRLPVGPPPDLVVTP